MGMKKEVRINSDKVRETCIKQNWYTQGTCKEYENLLYNLCDKNNATDEDVMAVIYDIAEHTNLDKLCQEYGIGETEVVRLYKEYINNGGKVSPFNTEPCRKYLQEKVGEKIEPEDVLWLFYHTK